MARPISINHTPLIINNWLDTGSWKWQLATVVNKIMWPLKFQNQLLLCLIVINASMVCVVEFFILFLIPGYESEYGYLELIRLGLEALINVMLFWKQTELSCCRVISVLHNNYLNNRLPPNLLVCLVELYEFNWNQINDGGQKIVSRP